MRMVNVTITAILGITMVIIGAYASQAALFSSVDALNDTLRSDLETNADALAAWDLVTVRVSNAALIWGGLTIFGFILWWFMSAFKRDEVSGVTYE